MMYYLIEFKSPELNPPKALYDVVTEKSKRREYDKQAFNLLGSLPEHLVVPQGLFFSPGVEPRDILTMSDLSRKGIVCNERLLDTIQSFHLPKHKVAKLDIKHDILGVLTYSWIAFEPRHAFEFIDYSASSFYRGSTFVGKRFFSVDSQEALIAEIRSAKTLEDTVRVHKLVFASGFDFDIFSLPRLTSGVHCTEKVKIELEIKRFSGFGFTPSEVFSKK